MRSRVPHIAAGIGIVLILLVVGVYEFEDRDARGVAAAHSVVEDFGAHLQNVSLQSPDAASAMAKEYGPYVTPDLLAAWQKDPMHAPGRTASSPWPESIEITQFSSQGEGYLAQGAVILTSSTGKAGIIPVYLQLVQQGGKWKIAAYQEVAVPQLGQ